MNVYIQTDIEGTAGFVFFENRKNDSHENIFHRTRMRKLQTGEVNAAVRAAFDAGAESVVINDNHGCGYNILFEELDPRCEIIHGRNGSGPAWLPDLDSSIDAMVLVGMHAMAGTEKALLPHTLWMVNNGEYKLSEPSSAAALAGDLDIPTVFVCGDDLVCAEMREKVPGIETAVVKKALGTYMARSRCPEKAREMIYQGVLAGLKRRKKIKPFKIPGPCSVNLLESKKGNHDQREGLHFTAPEGTGATFTEAFTNSINHYNWHPQQILIPDGFEYP